MQFPFDPEDVELVDLVDGDFSLEEWTDWAPLHPYLTPLIQVVQEVRADEEKRSGVR